MMEHAILIGEIDIKVTLENKNISNFISNVFLLLACIRIILFSWKHNLSCTYIYMVQ